MSWTFEVEWSLQKFNTPPWYAWCSAKLVRWNVRPLREFWMKATFWIQQSMRLVLFCQHMRMKRRAEQCWWMILLPKFILLGSVVRCRESKSIFSNALGKKKTFSTLSVSFDSYFWDQLQRGDQVSSCCWLVVFQKFLQHDLNRPLLAAQHGGWETVDTGFEDRIKCVERTMISLQRSLFGEKIDGGYPSLQ